MQLVFFMLILDSSLSLKGAARGLLGCGSQVQKDQRAEVRPYSCTCVHADKEVSLHKISLSAWKHVANTQQIINNSSSTRILPQDNSTATKITITIHQPLVWQGKRQKLNLLHKRKREILQGSPLVVQRDRGFPALNCVQRKE